MMSLTNSRRKALLLLCAFPLCFGVSPVTAQETKPLPKAYEQKVQLRLGAVPLSAYVATIASSAHVNILVDGEPALLKADLDFDGSVKQAIYKLADVFDYTWTVAKSGCVLMSKRFKSLDERPQATLPEMTRMARDVVSALTSVDYDKDSNHWNQLIVQIGRSLTPAQYQLLTTKMGLHGSDLNPDQLHQLQQAMLFSTLNNQLQMWQTMLSNLVGMDASALSTRKHPVVPGDIYNRIFDYIYSFHSLDGSEHSVSFPSIDYQSDATGHVVTP